jgi:hypothetical protein
LFTAKKREKNSPTIVVAHTTAGGWPHVLWLGVVRTSSYRCRMQIIIIVFFTANTHTCTIIILFCTTSVCRGSFDQNNFHDIYLYIFHFIIFIYIDIDCHHFTGYECELNLKKIYKPVVYLLQCINFAMIIYYNIPIDSYITYYIYPRENKPNTKPVHAYIYCLCVYDYTTYIYIYKLSIAAAGNR